MSKTFIHIKKIEKKYIDDNYECLLAKLHEKRRIKTMRYNNRDAVCVSVAAGLLLERVVKDRLKLQPEDIRIAEEECGKPYIIGYENFCYNISHSGDYVVMAYGDSPVGVDIEKIRIDGMSKTDMAVAKRCFTLNENTYVNRTKEGAAERFCRIWTMKESYLKLIGCGVSVPLNSFEVDFLHINDIKTHDGVKDELVAGVKDKDCKYLSFRYEDYMITLCVKDVSDVEIINSDES